MSCSKRKRINSASALLRIASIRKTGDVTKYKKYPCFKGAVGFTVSAGKYGQNAKAIRKAVNKAGLRMVYVDRYFGISTF